MSTRAYTIQDVISLLSQESEPFVDTSGTETFNNFLLAGETSHIGDSATTIATAASATPQYASASALPLQTLEAIYGNVLATNLGAADLFASLCSTATGDLHAWTQARGSFVNNVSARTVFMTTGADALLYGGHPLWNYALYYQVRFAWQTGAQPCIYFNYQPPGPPPVGGAYETWVRCRFDGTTMYIEKQAASTGTVVLVTSTPAALTSGAWYWLNGYTVGPFGSALQGTMSFQLYTDNPAGSIGTFITSIAGGVSEANLAPSGSRLNPGYMALGNAAGNTGPATFGGNFPQTVEVALTTAWPVSPRGLNPATGALEAWMPGTTNGIWADNARETAFAIAPMNAPAISFGTGPSAPLLQQNPAVPAWQQYGLSINRTSFTGVPDYWGFAMNANKGIPVAASTKYIISAYVQTVNVRPQTGQNGAYLNLVEYDSTGAVVKTWTQNSGVPFAPYSQVGTLPMTRMQYVITTQPTTAFIFAFPTLDSFGLATFADLQIQKANPRYGFATWS